MAGMNIGEHVDRLHKTLWGRHERTMPRWKFVALRLSRTLAVLFRDAAEGQLTLRAMSLVYTTLLSLVPLLALSFSVLKAFGVHNQAQPMLERFLAPLGENSRELTDRIIVFIGNMNVGVLGSIGLALLIYTSLSLIQKIEESFNFIWHIGQSRGFGERFSRYLTLLLIGPILVFSALGITATVMNAAIVRTLLDIEPFGRIVVGVSRVMPYLLVIGAFTFAYYFVPNTRVRPAAALAGGVVAGIAWQTAGWAFAGFAASSGSYTAIYSGFAVLILFLIWLYLSWLILLFGAAIAFYCQHPEYLVARGGEPRLSNRMRERVALGAMSLIAGRFLGGQAAPTVDSLAHQLLVPAHAIRAVLDALERQGLLVRSDGDPAGWLPARALERLPVREVLAAVRCVGESQYLTPDDLPLPTEVGAVLERIDQALDSALAEFSVKDIAALPETAGAPASTAAARR